MKTIRINRIPFNPGKKLFMNRILLATLTVLLIFSMIATWSSPRPAQALGETGWEKFSATPVILKGPTGTWDSLSAGEPSVYKDGATYKMWYSGEDANQTFRIGYATSTDGTTWVKHATNPILSVGATGAWDAKGVASPSVIKDGSTWKMWYMGTDVNDSVAIGLATSTDGIVWTKSGAAPVLTGSTATFETNGVGSPTVVLDGTTYKMWYTGKTGGGIIGNLAIGYAESTNGTTWTKGTSNPVLTAGTSGSWEGRGVGVAEVIKDGTVYKMWYTGYLSTGTTTTSKIGFATSPDGTAWTKYSGNPVLSTGVTTTWEGRGVGGVSVVKESSNTYKMWYSGLDSNLAASTGFAFIPTYTAQTSVAQFQRPSDLIIGVKHSITNMSSSGSQSGSGGIAGFTATATYNSAGINILAIGAYTPFTMDVPNIGAGTATYSGSAASPPESPSDVAYLMPRLIGDKDTTYTLTLTFNSIASGSSLPVNQAADAVLSGIKRGDARQDSNNTVSIIDALFIAQYLAQIRPVTDLNPINAASIRYDGSGGDRITIQDAMFIAQMLAQIRDSSFVML